MLESALTLLTICVLGQMTPGPDMMLIIKHATAGFCRTGDLADAQQGGSSNLRAAYFCILGVCLGLAFHVSLSILGLAVLIKNSPGVYAILRYAGALYVLYIGWKTITDSSGVDISGGGKHCTATARQGFREGLVCNLLNPKVTMFILSVFMQFVSPQDGLTEKLVYGGVIVGEGLVGWMLFVAFLNTPFMRRLYGDYAVVINRLTGLALLGLGSAIFIWG